MARPVLIKINFEGGAKMRIHQLGMAAKAMDPLMSIVHLLIIVVPSFAAGLLFGRSLLTGAFWGIAAEALGLFMVALPISSSGPRNGLSLAMISVSLVLGALAGALGFGALRLAKSRH